MLWKYTIRLIIPWAIASLTFEYINSPASFDQPKSLIGLITLPYYHLWYIPAFFLWAIVSYLLDKLKLNITVQLLGALILSYALNLEFTQLNSLGFSGLDPDQYGWYKFLSTTRPYLFFFLILGKFIKQKGATNKSKIIYSFLASISLIVICFYFGFPKFIYAGLFYTFNGFLMFALISVAGKESLPRNRVIEWLGTNSLPIYLWHIMGILIVDQFFVFENIYFKMSAYTVACIGVSFSILLTSKLKWVNRILFGKY